MRFVSTVAGTGGNGYNGDKLRGTSTTIGQPSGMWQDTEGNLYVTHSSNHRIRKVNTDGSHLTTIAGTGRTSTEGDGGLAKYASLYNPAGMWGDSNNILYFADLSNHRIRYINLTTGIIDRIVGFGGTGLGGYSADYGIANKS